MPGLKEITDEKHCRSGTSHLHKDVDLMLSCNLQFYRFFTGFPSFMLQAVNCSTRSILSLALGYPRPASCRRKACKNQLKAASASVAMELYPPGLQIRDIATETEGLKWPPEIGPKADVIAFCVSASCV